MSDKNKAPETVLKDLRKKYERALNAEDAAYTALSTFVDELFPVGSTVVVRQSGSLPSYTGITLENIIHYDYIGVRVKRDSRRTSLWADEIVSLENLAQAPQGRGTTARARREADEVSYEYESNPGK